MAAIVEQREKPPIQPTERTEAQYDMEENKRRHTERADEQDLIGDERENDLTQNTEEDEKKAHSADEHEVVEALLPVPLRGAVFEAHVLCSTGSVLRDGR
jgi:hypothetical protein